MYIIVIGGGDTGRSFVDLAIRDGHDIVVVEIDQEKAADISADYDCLVLNADATSESTLLEAGIDDADAVISTTNHDAANVMVMLLAQEHDVPNLLTVVHERSHLPVFDKIGVNVIENPQRLIAEYLYRSVQYPGVGDFVELADGTELVELTVEAKSPVTGQTLANAKTSGDLPEDALVAAVKRGDDLLPPDGETVLAAEDTVTVLVDEEHIDDVIAAVRVDG